MGGGGGGGGQAKALGKGVSQGDLLTVGINPPRPSLQEPERQAALAVKRCE